MKVSQSRKLWTLKVSSSAVAKTIKRLWWNWLSWGPRQERKTQHPALLQGKSSLEVPPSKRSPNKCIRIQVTDTLTVQRRRRGSDLHGRIAAKKPLIKRTRRRWTLNRWKSVLWSDESKFEIFGSNRHVFVRRRVGERMISTCVIPTMKHGGGGVMVWVLCWWHWFI